MSPLLTAHQNPRAPSFTVLCLKILRIKLHPFLFIPLPPNDSLYYCLLCLHLLKNCQYNQYNQYNHVFQTVFQTVASSPLFNLTFTKSTERKLSAYVT